MNFFEAFAGIGGFRLGLERQGFKCVGSCEIDKYASKLTTLILTQKEN